MRMQLNQAAESTTNMIKPRTFVHMDGNNLFHRQINMVNPDHGIDSMIGMAFHLILNSMKKEYHTWNATHAVFYLEGRSWRKDVYKPYKANRKVENAKRTEEEQANFASLMEAFNDLAELLTDKTNVSVVQNPVAEADDMIYMFIASHPDDKHILVSSDSDFYQLLRMPNVVIYDPVKDIQIKRDGIFDDYGNRLEFTINSTGKIKVGEKSTKFVCPSDWYEYALFLKCIRGDKGDNIFSAYPGVREKGTLKTVGIKAAYDDQHTKGYNWNNFMHVKWTDHEGVEQQVKDVYERNRLLIDLDRIPDDVRAGSLKVICEATSRPPVPAIEIGTSFMRFASRWGLDKIGKTAAEFMPMLKAKYE